MSGHDARKTLHLVLTGKGGVGKTVVARIVAEYVTDRCEPPLCFDTDQTNALFSEVPAFAAQIVDLFDDEARINPSRFDVMLNEILTAERSVVIDNGSSSYFETLEYIAENDLIETLQDAGFDIYLHCVVTGGAAGESTLANLLQMAENFGERINLCAWINHFIEPVRRDGKPFVEWPEFIENADLIAAVLEIPRMSSQLSQADFSLMLKEHLSFAEAVAPDSRLDTMKRSRLMRVRKAIFGAMDQAFEGFADAHRTDRRNAAPAEISSAEAVDE